MFALFVLLFASTAALAQDTAEAKPTTPKTITISESRKTAPADVKTAAKRGPVFRPTKDQIEQVQGMLKEKSLYNGESTGSYNPDTRAGIKKFQKGNGLKETGTLNRATLEKMGVPLTDAQKAIPVSESSFASSEKDVKAAKSSETESLKTGPKAGKPVIFRATIDQIKEAQRLLKSKTMYAGDESGKLDAATRAGLKKYQEANNLKSTGTLNQATLEAMGIALTEKQKGVAEPQK